MPVVIETTHLLRPWQEDEADPLACLLAKPTVARSIRLDGQLFTLKETALVHRRSMIPHFTSPQDDDPSGAGYGVEALVEGALTTPADFSIEEVALAGELQCLFLLEQEQVIRCFGPPCAPEGGAWNALNSLVWRVTNRVFERLHYLGAPLLVMASLARRKDSQREASTSLE